MMKKVDFLKSFVKSNTPILLQSLNQSDLEILAKHYPDSTIMMLDNIKTDVVADEADNLIKELIDSHQNPLLIFSNVHLYNPSQIRVLYKLVVDKPCPLILFGNVNFESPYTDNLPIPLKSRCACVKDD